MSAEDTITADDAAQADPSEVVTIDHAALSDIGLRREENQDSFGIIEGSGYRLFVVADGMGGVQGGALASSMAIETLKAEISTDAVPSADQVSAAIRKANDKIFERGSREPALSGMGTTLVALLFHGIHLTVFNVGDSRAYRFRNEEVTQLTIDHTLVQELVRSGSIDEEQAKNHPVSHMLTRSLGPAEEIEVDVFEIEDGPYEQDIFLLCSDGLYNLVKDGEMLTFILQHALDAAVEKLVELANKRGGTDNITIIAAEAGKGFAPLPEELRISSTEVSEREVISFTQREDAAINTEQPNPVQTKKSDGGSARTEADVHLNGSASEGPRPSDVFSGAGVEGGLSLERLRKSYSKSESADSATEDSSHSAKKGPAASSRQTRSSSSTTRTPRPAVIPKDNQEPVFRSNLSAILSILGAAVCGAMVSVLFLAPESHQNRDSSREAESASGDTRTSRWASRGDTEVSQDIPREHSAPVQAGLFTGGSLEGGLSTIERRQKTLSTRLRQLDEKLAALDAPLSGQVGQLIAEASSQLEVLEQRLLEVRTEVDSSARRLAVWSGRKKRFETSEPITMVAEVAVSSDEVRKRKEIFESATWQYLKEAEKLEYSPNDPELARNVGMLVRQRNERMDELFLSLRNAINGGILDAQQRISDMTIERDGIEKEMDALRDTISFSKVLSSGDQTARAAKRTQLVRDRDLLLAELNELTRLAENLPSLQIEPQSGAPAIRSGEGARRNSPTSSDAGVLSAR